MPRCSSAQRSVASAWREKRKQVVSRVRGVCDDVTCPFLHSGVVQVLKAGQVHTNDPFCCPNSPLQSSYIYQCIDNHLKTSKQHLSSSSNHPECSTNCLATPWQPQSNHPKITNWQALHLVSILWVKQGLYCKIICFTYVTQFKPITYFFTSHKCKRFMSW